MFQSGKCLGCTVLHDVKHYSLSVCFIGATISVLLMAS